MTRTNTTAKPAANRGAAAVHAALVAVALSLMIAAPASAREPHGWTGEKSRQIGPNGNWNLQGQRSINGNAANSSVAADGPNGRHLQSSRSSSYGDGAGNFGHTVTTGNGNSFNHDVGVTKNGDGSATVANSRTGPSGAGSNRSTTYTAPNW